MKESYVSFGQAQALKRLGFDWKCNNYHCKEGYMPTFIYPPRNFNGTCSLMYSAPALHIAQKWLREVKELNVLACMVKQEALRRKWYWEVLDKEAKTIDITRYRTKLFDTYEAALSAGLDAALGFLEDNVKEQ